MWNQARIVLVCLVWGLIQPASAEIINTGGTVHGVCRGSAFPLKKGRCPKFFVKDKIRKPSDFRTMYNYDCRRQDFCCFFNDIQKNIEGDYRDEFSTSKGRCRKGYAVGNWTIVKEESVDGSRTRSRRTHTGKGRFQNGMPVGAHVLKKGTQLVSASCFKVRTKKEDLGGGKYTRVKESQTLWSFDLEMHDPQIEFDRSPRRKATGTVGRALKARLKADKKVYRQRLKALSRLASRCPKVTDDYCIAKDQCRTLGLCGYTKPKGDGEGTCLSTKPAHCQKSDLCRGLSCTTREGECVFAPQLKYEGTSVSLLVPKRDRDSYRRIDVEYPSTKSGFRFNRDRSERCHRELAKMTPLDVSAEGQLIVLEAVRKQLSDHAEEMLGCYGKDKLMSERERIKTPFTVDFQLKEGRPHFTKFIEEEGSGRKQVTKTELSCLETVVAKFNLPKMDECAPKFSLRLQYLVTGGTQGK